ncbi:hypothetical protein [Nocardioides sp.]|uniref:hypothetical protein n=1 Tax=Nocardioides sp. TaxID=35761 RepID=UPI002D7F17A5|nr:hypothetical protein [Nocardioides sp.]HET8960649.1 hypothetical protein [Nocardioides sp.]
MSNQIRPQYEVLVASDHQILEIGVESAVDTFTWVVVDSRGKAVVHRTMDRGESGEFSVTVGADEKDELWADSSMERHFPQGDYRVRLYHGAPNLRNTTYSGQFGKLDLLDEDAFSVVSEPQQSATEGDDSDIGEPFRVELVRGGPEAVTLRSSPVSFQGFSEYLRKRQHEGGPFDKANSWPAFGDGPYRAIRDAAREYVGRSTVHSFHDLVPAGYLEGKLDETAAQFPRIGLPRDAKTAYLPAVELLYNYWLEQGGLVQTLLEILARFQNRRNRGRAPLDRFDVTPLMPLRNKLWGYAEDEVHRMTVRRRAVEYEYEYGLSLIGRAVPRPSTVVERRHGFLEAFHQVLFLAHRYFKELDDLTVQADAFPLYRALRDCHIVLSQGTQNQYGEMAVAARAEFLVMQSILAEPQMREFLGGRPMTPYPEPWMDRVDAMKSIQGWTDVSIMHFNDLAVIGEQLVLTIRLGSWADTGVNGTHAATWAQAFRSAIQQYAAAYRTATGVDLSREPNAQPPAILLARRASGGRAPA